MLKKLFVVGMVLSLLFGCSSSPKQETGNLDFEVSLTIDGSTERVLTTEDFNKMTFTEVEATLKKKDGSETLIKAKGVLMSDLLTYLAVNPSTLSVVALDGYEKEYDAGIIGDEKTILAFFNDGSKLEDDGPIWLIAGNQSGNMWIKNLDKVVLP